MKNKLIYLTIVCLFMISCKEQTNQAPDDQTKEYNIAPLGFPPIPFPSDNLYSKDKFILGRMLFYEQILSKDSTIKSCSHCMKQKSGFTDNLPLSFGFGEQPQPRNGMPVTNSAYRKQIFWDGRANRIESPAYRSIFLPQVFGSDTNDINKRLRTHSTYPELFRKAFGTDAEPGCYLASLAIATFVRCLVSGTSPYDEYINGNVNAITDIQKRGMKLFFSDRANCSKCHSGFLFTDGKFHNTGVVTHYFDFGRWYVTGDYADRGKFLTPSLRNVEVTGPYMHNAELNTLEAILEHYNRGGRPFINKDTILKPLNLSLDEQAEIIAFLKSLTDWKFLNNPDFANPFHNNSILNK